MLDDLDRRLINALQISPRTPWSVLAPILRTDASTLSRRWSRPFDEAGRRGGYVPVPLPR